MSATSLSSVRVDPVNKPKYDVPPALVDAVREDPAAIQPAARVMALTLLHEQFVESPGYTPAQKLALVEHLSKMGNLVPKERSLSEQPGSGVSITINIPQVGGTPAASITIDQPATPVAEPDS